jgi:hypothetical protein
MSSVFLFPKTKEDEKEIKIFQLTNPKYQTETYFSIIDDIFYELQQTGKFDKRCWFNQSEIIRNGSLYFYSKYDPLFLLLPQLDQVIIFNNQIDKIFVI